MTCWSGDTTTVGGNREWYLIAVTCVILLVGVGAVATVPASGGASGVGIQEETTPPELHSGEKVNTTAVEVLFVDDDGMDTSSITASEFLLSEGELSGINVTAVGTNATVRLVLAEPIDSDQLTVGVRSDSTIQDVNGTAISSAEETQTVTITGMDGSPPEVLGATVTDAIGGPAEIRFNFDTELSGLTAEITGPVTASLDLDDFDNPRPNRYVAEYEPPESGTYTLELHDVTDSGGNRANLSIVRTFEANRTEPSAAIGIDFGASGGLNITFDGSQSRGDRLSYTWAFDDGTTASGKRVAHEFEPGRYNVTLTVRNEYGNTGTDRLELNLTEGLEDIDDVVQQNESSTATVLVTRSSPTNSQNTLVSVTGAPATDTVDIGTVDDAEEPLVAREPITLDKVSVTPSVDTSFSLALVAVGNGSVADASDDGRTVLGGFTVVSDLGEAELSGGEFTFSVNASRLDALGLSAEDITLHREVESTWEPLDTGVRNTDGAEYQFVSIAPGFSRFAVVGATGQSDEQDAGENGPGAGDEQSGEEGEPVRVREASVNTTEIVSGGNISVEATVENRGEEPTEFRAGLEIDGEVVEVRDPVEVTPGGTETVEFTRTLQDPGTVTVGVNGTSAGEVRVTLEDGEIPEIDTAGLNVTELTVNETSIEVGGTVRVDATIQNDGETTTGFIGGLEIDGEVVDTEEVPEIPPGEDFPVSFEYRFDQKGTYQVSIRGGERSEEVGVGQDGRFGFLSFLPLGLLQTVLAFVGVPLLFLYLVLKSVAFYMGY